MSRYARGELQNNKWDELNRIRMARFRFNLRTVFVLATAVVLFLGYSQHRRRTILREAESLKQGIKLFTASPADREMDLI